MPMDHSLDKVYGSTLKSAIHVGPNQAGNKSMLTYRADIGVPGYTGYSPSFTTLMAPAKGTTVHTGRVMDGATHDNAALATVAQPGGYKKGTENLENFTLLPDQTHPRDTTGGGYWFSQRQVGVDVPLQGTTIYRTEVLRAAETAAAQLSRTSGVLSTLANYEAARERSGSAPHSHSYSPEGVAEHAAAVATAAAEYSHLPIHLQSALSPTGRPAISITPSGSVVGYQTTYGSTYASSPKQSSSPLGSPTAARLGCEFGRRSSETAPRPPVLHLRPAVMPNVMSPRMFGAQSTYGIEYGADGSAPLLDKAAPSEAYQTRLATTRDLAHGTSRCAYVMPGYAGHLPASQHNVLGKAQIDNAQGKVNQKADITLYDLDQFGRSRLPHYTGFKPQAASNITMDQPSQGPTGATTSGAANLTALRRGAAPGPPQDHANYLNSKAGLLSFFSSGSEYVSHNGQNNAELYYQVAKPVDRRMQTSQVSKVTDYGAPFNARASLV